MIVLEDIEEMIGKWHDKFWNRYVGHKRDSTVYPVTGANNGLTDATGALNMKVYQNTSGRHLVIGRVVYIADGFDAHLPYTNAAAFLWLFGGVGNVNRGNVFDTLPKAAAGPVFPFISEYSGHNAIRMKQNETLSIALGGGPASTNITVIAYGYLEPTYGQTDL